MRRLVISVLMVAVIIVGGWTLYNKDHINSTEDFFKLAGQHISTLTEGKTEFAKWSRPQKDSIRIASFNIQVFGDKKAGQPDIMATLGAIVREFEIVAIQEIRSKDATMLTRFLDEINSSGRNFRYVISERLGRSHHREQYAFIFDTDVIQLDGAQSYTIHDPDDLLRREPLVAWFRTRNVNAEKAFTFTLVNLHLDSRTPARELAHLNQIFRVIRNDGRGEDDVIIVGDFNLSNEQMSDTNSRSGLVGLISNTPTNTRNSKQYDNVIIDRQATTEFTGRAGVFDFLKTYNLSMEDALRVSDHLPVWAEFQLEEGGSPSHVARQENPIEQTKVASAEQSELN